MSWLISAGSAVLDPRILPRRDIVPVGHGRTGGEFAQDVLGSAFAPDQPLQQRSAGQAGWRRGPRTGDFACCIQIAAARSGPFIDPNAAARIVGRGDYGYQIARDIDPIFQARCVKMVGKWAKISSSRNVGAQVEIDVRDVVFEHFLVDAARHHITRG